MTRRSPHSSSAAFVMFGVLLLAVFAALIWLANGVLGYPGQAARLYGLPDRSLNLIERHQLSYVLIQRQSQLLEPLDPGASSIPFAIEPGESTAAILSRLESSGLITDQEALRAYLLYTGWDTQLKPGEFRLSANMRPIDIAASLVDAGSTEATFGVLPGWRAEEIAASLPSSGLAVLPQDFLQAVTSPPPQSPIRGQLPAGASLEGFLFPGLYSVPRQIDAQGLVILLSGALNQQLTPEIRQAYSQQILTLHEAVTLASIVEREAVVSEEKPLIASVFLNRWKIGMKLDADPTVQYALGFNAAQDTWWTNPLTFAHLEIDSPYNTYRYAGLPPSPIANPDLDSLLAVAFPEVSPYYYFRAQCDGSGRHSFSVTLDEHIAKGCP